MSDQLPDPSEFLAFYVAFPLNKMQSVLNIILAENPSWYLICPEESASSHQDVSGNHIHVLATLTDKQYRRIIHNIKKLTPLRGRATTDGGRSYGKVKMIRDLERMGAYTLKNNICSEHGIIISNFPNDVIQSMKKVSHHKDDVNDYLPKLMDYISDNLERIGERNLELYNSAKEVPWQTQSLEAHIKEAIVEFYKHGLYPMKPPTKCRMNYLATFWALEHSNWEPARIVAYFYR